jgi:hypothetical protein
MSQKLAELLLLISSALFTGVVIFVADVLQRVMNDLDEATFGRFVTILYKRAVRGIFFVTFASLTFIGMIPYFFSWGFANSWFAAGLVVFALSSIISKALSLPVCKRVIALEGSDSIRLGEERLKLQGANNIRAVLCALSLVLMAVGFV